MSTRKAVRLFHVMAGIAGLICAMLAPAAMAQSVCYYTVTSTADSGPGTLRAGLANGNAPTICFSLPNNSTITLASTLQIINPVTITNNPATALTISGNQQVQVLSVSLPSSTSQANITGVTITGGVGAASGNSGTIGGGISINTGTVTLTNVIVTGNSASYGGGILNGGTLFLNSCTISNNAATTNAGGGTNSGGGLSNGGTATIFGGAFTGNTTTGVGGAISNTSQLTISGGTQILNNTAQSGGGAVENESYATATISSAYIGGNSTQAASGSTYTTNGGGIENGSAANLSVSQTTVAYNNADGNGAGISNNDGALNVDESTVASNIGEGIGGGIYSTTGLTLTSNTISDNIGYTGWSGIYDVSNGNGDGTAVNNIIAGNGSNGDCAGCAWIATTDNFVGGTPNLNNLAMNGGLTPTMMPFPGSPVIRAGNASMNSDQTDQRGLSRVSANGIDYGAVQTHYTSVSFYTQPAGTVVNQPMATVAVQVLEVDGNTVNYPLGVAVYLSLLDANGNPSTATLGNNFGEQPTVNGGVTSAQFPGLTVNTAGTYELQATTYQNEPGGQTDPTFNAVSSTFPITAPATPVTVTWAPPSYVYGPLPAAELNATAMQNGVNVPGSFAYTFTATGATVSAGNLYTVGSYPVTVVFTNAASGQQVTATATLVVTKATPTVTLVTPPAIVPGLALSTATLHATATGVGGALLPGTFTYSKALGTVLAAGSQTVSATFAPTDSTDYAGGSSASATFTVLTPTASSTSLTVTPSSGTGGTADTLLAQVLPSGSGPGVVNGMVDFAAGSTALSSQALALVPSTAHFSLGASITFNSYSQLAAYSADLNGDGVADQVLISGSQMEILLADPSHPGSYLAQSSLSTYGSCSYVSGLDLGDVNGDGLPDIVAACQNYQGQANAGPLLLYLNQGNGSFAAPTTIAGMLGAQVVVADFDGDGTLDLVSLGASCPTGVASCISFQHGNGDGTFNAANYSVLNGASASDTFDSLQAADFNGDGRADLAFIYRPGGSGGQVSVFVNSATSSGINFGVVATSGNCGAALCYLANATVNAGVSGNTPLFVVADDLNGDGLPDLAAVMTDNSSGSGNTLSVALNSASGGTVRFPANTTDTVYAGAQSLAIADFNRDGIADVAVYSQTTNAMQVLLGDGTGAFPSVLTSTTLPAITNQLPVFSVGDANGDGFPDLLLAEPNYYSAAGLIAVTSGTAESSLGSTAPSATTNYSVTAVPASTAWTGSSGSATFTVTSQTTQTGLTVTPVNSTYGTVLTATATVLETATGAPVQGGTVTFVATGNTLGTVSVVNGSATLSNILFAIVGQHTIQGLYSGTTGQAASSSSPVLITITKSTPPITWPTPAPITSTTPLGNAQLDAVIGSSGSFPAPSGTIVYTPAAGTMLSVGTHTLSVAFTPSNTTDYNPATATVQILVTGTPIVTVVVPPVLLPGASLTTANVHARATDASGAALAGTFSYSPLLGTVPAAGVQTETVTFAPTNTVNYVPASASASFTVLAAKATTTALTASPNPAVPGTQVVLSASVAPGSGVTGAVPGTVAFTSPGGPIASPRLALDRAHATFTSGAAQNLGGLYGYSTYSADFNGDGVADLLVFPTSGQPQLVLSQIGSSPALGAPLALNLGAACSNPIGSTVGDVNGDGLPDVLAACVNTSNGVTSLVVLLNLGGGTFAPSVPITTLSGGIGAVQMTVGDFNGDGLKDLVVLTECVTQACYPTLDLLTGDGTGAFTVATTDFIYNAGLSDTFANLLPGDFNHDGRLDIALLHFSNANPYGVAEVWKNDGGSAPNFGMLVATTTCPGPCYVADSVITAGNGSATLSSLVSADFNVDGLPDLAMVTAVINPNGSNAYSSRSVALNASSGGTLAFPAAATDVQTSGGVTSIAAADFDGDGIPDVAFYDSNSNTVRVLHGAGDGSFAFTAPNLVFTVNTPSACSGPQCSGASGLVYPALAAGDTNGDGYPDLLIAQQGLAQNQNTVVSAQQFAINGASLAATTITAPTAGTTYTAASTPAVPLWAGSSGTVSLGSGLYVTQTSLTVTPAAPVYGTPLTLSSQVVIPSTGGLAHGGSVTFTEDGVTLSTVNLPSGGGAVTVGSVLPTAGQHVFGASYSGSTGEAPSAATNSTVQVAKFTPTVHWNNPAAITTETPLSGTQLNAIAAGLPSATLALPGSFGYAPAAGTFLSAGSHTLDATFIPADTVDYNSASGTAQIQVNIAGTQTALNVSAQQSTYGQPLTLTAHVTNTSGSVVVSGGTITFSGGGTALSSVAVTNGVAMLSGVVLPAGTPTISAVYTPSANEGASSATGTVTIGKAAPVLTWPTPAAISSTAPLSAAELDATAAGVTGTTLPGAFVYTPGSGTLSVGIHTLSVVFTPTDAVDYTTASAQVSISVVAQTITLTSISPATTTLGTTPLPVTLTGSGFTSTSVVRLNGSQLPTILLSATQVRVTVPALNLENAGTLSFTIYDTASQAVSNAATLSVTAPTATAVVTTPATVVSGDQPSVAITLANTYPVDIAGTYTLSFTPAGPDGVDDPNVEFSNGQRTIGFTISAGQNAPASPETFQAGTVEGTISIDTVLTAGGVDVTPAALTTPVAIAIAPSAPVITGVTVVNGAGVALSGTGGVSLVDANGLLTVVVTGYSNTREMTQAEFTFTGPGVGDLATPSVIVPATSLFGTWYGNTGSGAYGSTFSYTQTFQLSNPATVITGASVTLTNTVGTSQSVSTQ